MRKKCDVSTEILVLAGNYAEITQVTRKDEDLQKEESEWARADEMEAQRDARPTLGFREDPTNAF